MLRMTWLARQAPAKMLPFLVSLIVACVLPRFLLRPIAGSMAIIFGLMGAAQADQIHLFWLIGFALSVVEVVAAFLLVWGIRHLISSRKKGNQ
jgi:ethanolamine transporter EutH